MIKSVLALKISLIKYVLMCCLLLSNFVALAQTATMKLTFDVSHLFVPNYKGEGLNGENVLDLRYHFRIDIYKNDALIETGLPEKILDFSIPVDKKNEWYPFHEIPDVSNDGPNKMIFSRIIEFDPNAEYKARVYFRLEEYDNDGAIDKGIWICGSDGGYDEWDKKQFDFTSYFNELICNSYHEPNINTTDFIGGCRNTYNDEHPQNLLFGQRGYYQLDFTAEIFHIDLPTEETVCSNELTEGISIVDLMNPFVSGYDRRLNLYNPVEGGPEEEETNGYAFDIIEGFGGLPWPSSWVTAMRWKGIDNDNDDFLYLSYNTINGTSSFGEPKITLPGNYQLEVGYISYPTIMHINSNFSIGGNYEFFPSQTQTVEIIANPSPVIDHVLDAYFICPGEVLTLGEDYEPVGENLLVTENYPNPPPPAGSVFPSPNENQSEGLEVDGLDFTWFKTHNAEGDDIQDICMGYTPTMEIEEPGQYLLTIEHHYYHPFSSQYNSCISTHPFVVTYGPGPDIVLPPYVEMCPQNLNNDGTIDLNASVCLTSCDPNAIAETNGYHFEWSRGGVILNPIEVPQDPADPITYADMPTYAANTPGIYIVKATNNITQCFSYKQIEVIACNEQNFDKIVPLSLVNVLENIDSDGSGDNDIEATATLTVADPTDCSISEPIERKALVKLNYHRGQHTDIEGADDWVLMVEYEINGVPAESPLIINNIGGQPTYLAVNEHLLDPCDDQVVILEVVSVQAFDGSIANSPNAITMDDLPADIHLELEQKIYRLSPLSSLVPLLSVGNIDINQKVQIDWTEVEGALEYELMIAFEDEFMEPSQKLSGSGNVSEDAFFRNYGYKIETNNNSYVLDVTYPEGNLFFRVRPIGRHVGPDVQGNYSFRDYGDWSVYQTLSVEGFHGATNLKSWQKTIIFAEDSKHKEVVSYFDNLMRNEGVVTHLNSDGTVLRAHTFYDHEGRPTLQTLPFAEIGSSLEFEAHQYMAEGESTLLSAKDFDFGIQPQLETNYGSANYYSPASEMLTPDLMVRFPNLEFIPNANGFVTTQSVFKNDGTGRIIRQSGVGETFSLKAPNLEHHETRYYYATATSSELHRLFGSNVGNPNHYKKQAVLDPNGQVSVSYLDMQDRVIATALSGETPDNLVSLANVPENFTLQMDERNIWDAEQNAFILEHEILNTVEDTDYEFKYDISTIVNSLSYIFPGQQNVFEQEYSEVPDDGWAASNNWQITNGTAILDNGYLLFQNEQSNLGGFTATLTLDIPEVNNTSEYIVLAQFKDVVYPPVVEFSTDQSTFQPIVLSENQKLFHVFNASNTVQPQLRITFPDAITYGELASLDFVKVYEKQFVPILYSNLNFEGSTIEEDGNNTSTVTWTTNDVVQISTSNDVAEFIERIGDEANDPNDSDFEATLSIVFPASNVDRNFELVFNASFYDPVTDLHFYIEDVDQGEVKVLNFGEFTIGASTSTTVDFKWEADNLNHLPNTFSKKLMELNYFKIFEIVDGEQVDIFKICAACEYDFTTYIIDENGNKVPLTAVNVIDDVDEPALDINATITKDGFDCNGVTPPTLVGENLFDIKIGSESIADANFTAIDENLDVLGSNNVYPELTFEANLPNIGTYKVYKKLALNNNSVSVALESNKAILQEGYIYQYIKDQAQIVDLDALCTFTCEDACAASVVALINDNLGLDYFDADRIKIADLYDALANVDHPDYVEWTELFDNCKEENFCDDPVAIMPEYQSGLSAELACEGMLGQMKNQISEPREFYGDIANNEDITDQERSDQYFAFLYEDYTNFELESLGGMLVDEINIDNNIIATDNIRNWVDAIFGMLSSVGNTPDNPFGVDFQTTQNNEVVKGEFILNHWNGTLTTNEKDFLLANYNTQNNTNYTTYDELLEENAVNPLNYTLPDDITDWEDIYMVFHREYIHYLYCKNDVDGRAYMTNLRVEPTTWSAAQTSGHLYPLSNDAATIVGSYNGGNINIGNLSESSKDPLFDTEPFSGLINEFLGNNYLSSYKKISNENELINLWQFLDEQGEYGCILYGVTEDLNYDDDYFEIPGNQANFPPAWNNCWPSVPGFQHASGEVLGQMKWQKFVNFYSGQREKLKASVFENSGGTYFDDAFAINVKPDDGTEESFNEAQNTYPVEMCESQCVSNVATWIDGLKAYCEAQAIEYYQNNTTPPAPSVLDDEIAANNLAIDGIADELSSICLDNCQFNQLTAYLTQEDLDQTTDPLYVLLNGLNILYINDALVAYVALPEAEKPEHFLEQLFITRVTVVDITVNSGNPAACQGTCNANANNWIQSLQTGWSCSFSVADEAYLRPLLENLCLDYCSPYNPAGWLSTTEQQRLAEILMGLPDAICFSELEIEDFFGENSVIEQIFIEYGIQVVVDGSHPQEICQPSKCLEGIVDHFWHQDLEPGTSYTSEDCSFENVNFQEDYLTLVDNPNCPKCFTTLFWVDDNGDRIHLPNNGLHIGDPVYTYTTPFEIQEVTNAVTPVFANYSATLLPAVNATNPAIPDNDTYCSYLSERSSPAVLSDGLEVPYISQILDGDNQPIISELNGTNKYYLYPVTGQASINDLNDLLKTAFNSQRTKVIDFSKTASIRGSTTSSEFSFDCLEAILSNPSISLDRKNMLQDCVLDRLSTSGNYQEEDFNDCLGILSPEEASICNDIEVAYRYAYAIELFDAPSSLQISSINGKFGGQIESLNFKQAFDCTSQPVVSENCLSVCTFQTEKSNYTNSDQPYIQQIYNEANQPILDGTTKYYLKEGPNTIAQLESVLTANLGTAVEIEFTEYSGNDNGCNTCPPPTPELCNCLGYNTFISYNSFTPRRWAFEGDNAFGILHGSYTLVDYDATDGITLNTTAVNSLQTDLRVHLDEPNLILIADLAKSSNFQGNLNLSFENLPADITGVSMLTGIRNYESWEVISNDCSTCYDTPYDPSVYRTFDSCATFLQILSDFDIAISDTTDCLEIEERYTALNARIRRTTYAYKIAFKNVPVTFAEQFSIDFRNDDLSQSLNAAKIGDCKLTDNCLSEGQTVYLYSISFDYTGAACDNSLNENCTEDFPVLAIFNPIRTDYTHPTTEVLAHQCHQNWQANVTVAAANDFAEQWADMQNQMGDAFMDACKNVVENYGYTYLLDEHHYTLYYYDNSGSLLQTIPPEGVQPLTMTSFPDPGNNWNGDEPDHYLRTRYKYNSRNQVSWQETPDAGESNFWYNKKGQLILSQNSKQAANIPQKYSFTTYDEHGRIVWVGEIDLGGLIATPFEAKYSPSLFPAEEYPHLVNFTAAQIFRALALDDGTFPFNDVELRPTLTDLTHTIYDRAVFVPDFYQKNLRNRVSASYRFDNYDNYTTWQSGINDEVNFSAYSYDEIGNVQTLMQHVGFASDEVLTPSITFDQYKRVDYQYDLVSGNVNRVLYQKGKPDQFIHRYEYDSDNRITHVYTTRDEIIEQLEAEYFYYPHGPLARVELGEDKVQALDYYYTLHGWLKGVNGTEVNDPGQDGINTAFNNLNEFVARDEFAFQLGYFDQDYRSIANNMVTTITDDNWGNPLWDPNSTNGSQHHNVTGFSNNVLEGHTNQSNPVAYNGLYNGNIGQMMSYLPSMGADSTLISHYQYDQLNRIKGAVGKIEEANRDPLFYQTVYNYDAMGNIIKLYRGGVAETATGLVYQDMDDLTYHYNYGASPLTDRLANNKLRHVNDAVDDANFTDDIDDQSVLTSSPSNDNYRYDEIGNLTQDNAEGIETIKWDVYGKITDIERASNNNKPNLSFRYDATGNRIMKIVKPRTLEAGVGVLSDPSEWFYTFYFRDAQGNIIATDDRNPSDLITREYNIYGSARVGTLKDIQPPIIDNNAVGNSVLTKSRRNYELTNHLGNVMTIVTDLKRRGKAFTDNFEFTTGSWISQPSLGSNSTIAASAASLSAGKYKLETAVFSNPADPLIFMSKSDYPFKPGRQYKLEAFVDLNGMPFGLIAVFDNNGPFIMQGYNASNADKWTLIFTAPGTLDPNSLPIALGVGIGVQVGQVGDAIFIDEFSIYDITGDNEMPYYADVKSAQDYYPFGMLIPNRTYNKIPSCEPVVTNQVVDIINEDYDDNDKGDWEDGEIEFSTDNYKLVAEVASENNNTAIAGRVYSTVIGEEYTISFDVTDLSGLNGASLLVYHTEFDGTTFDEVTTVDPSQNPFEIISEDEYTFTVTAGTELLAINLIVAGSSSVVGSTFTIDNFIITGPQQIRTFNCAGDNYLAINYRFGFNGKELDSEGMGGGGSTYDYGFRIYNPQIAKFLSVDPLSSEYPFYTPYQFSGNKPISNIDLDGREDLYYLISFNEKTGLSQIKLKHQQDGVLCNCWGANLYVSYGGQTYYQSSFPTSRAGQWFFNYLLGTPTLDDALNSFVGHSKTYIDNMFSSKLNVGEMRAASNDKFEKDWNDMIESIAYAKAGQLYNSKFIKRGMEGAKFAQTSVRSDRKFSPDGIKKYSELAGKPINTIDDLSSAIRSKIIAVKDVQVDYVIMNGQAVILNTRTSAALNNAGIPREQWHGVNRTGQIVPGLDKTYDDLAKDQISKNKLDVNNLPNDPPK